MFLRFWNGFDVELLFLKYLVWLLDIRGKLLTPIQRLSDRQPPWRWPCWPWPFSFLRASATWDRDRWKSIWICPFWGVKISIFMLTLKISVFWMVICTLENLNFYVIYGYLMLSKLSSCVNEIFKCDSSEGSLFQTKPNEPGRVFHPVMPPCFQPSLSEIL